MTSIKLLDADFLINFIRTLSLIEKYEDVNQIINDITSESHFSLITTNFVRNEVNQRISPENPKYHDELFLHKKSEAKKIKNNLFKKINVRDVSNNKVIPLFGATTLKNMGEISLVGLLSSNYSSNVYIPANSVHIVSNNTKDVIKYLKRIKVLNENLKNMNEFKIHQCNYDFYYELFSQINLDPSLRKYFVMVSNIDARVYDKDKFKGILHSKVYP